MQVQHCLCTKHTATLRRSWTVIATDGVPALRRGSLTAEAFPSGWRTNTLRAVVATPPEAPLSSSGVAMHPQDVLNCGLYAGDSALLRAVAGGSFAPSCCVYVNAPEEEHALGGEGGAEAGELHISALTAANLNVKSGDTVALELYSPPDAAAVTVAPLNELTPPQLAALPSILHEYFGVTSAEVASAAVSGAIQQLAQALSDSGSASPALAAAGGGGGSAWMAKYAQQARCLRRPLGAGDVFAVPVLGLQGPVALQLPPVDGLSPVREGVWRKVEEALGGGVADSPAAPTPEVGLALADLAQVAQGSASGVSWIAFEVSSTSPRGTVTVVPGTTISSQAATQQV